MRRVNIIHNLKQRMNEILGSGIGAGTPGTWAPLAATLSNDSVYELNPWSIQSAMLANVERLSAALIDDPVKGKVLTGMTVTPSIFPTVTILPGKAVTADGKLISLDGSITNIAMGSSLGDVRYIYLNYVLAAIEGDTDPNGRNTPFMGGPTKKTNIVYDELCSILGSGVNNEPYRSAVLEVSTTLNNGDGKVLIATVTSGTGVIATIEMNSGLNTAGNVYCDNLQVSGAARIPDISGDVDVDGDITCVDFAASGNIDLPHINGDVDVNGDIACIDFAASGNADVTGDLDVDGDIECTDLATSGNATIPNINGNVAVVGNIACINFAASGNASIPNINGNVAVVGDIACVDFAASGNSTIPDINGNVAVAGDIACVDIAASGNASIPNINGNIAVVGTVTAGGGFKIDGVTVGVDGNFTTVDGKTVQVSKGIITSIT